MIKTQNEKSIVKTFRVDLKIKINQREREKKIQKKRNDKRSDLIK